MATRLYLVSLAAFVSSALGVLASAAVAADESPSSPDATAWSCTIPTCVVAIDGGAVHQCVVNQRTTALADGGAVQIININSVTDAAQADPEVRVRIRAFPNMLAANAYVDSDAGNWEAYVNRGGN